MTMTGPEFDTFVRHEAQQQDQRRSDEVLRLFGVDSTWTPDDAAGFAGSPARLRGAALEQAIGL